MPQLTDEQIEALCEVIVNARIRRQRKQGQST
jgi:hypothetical protein